MLSAWRLPCKSASPPSAIFASRPLVRREDLPPRERAARDEREGVELGVGGERGDLAFQMQARVVVDQARQIDARAFAEREE